MRKLVPGVVVAIAASVVVATSLGAPDRKAPRIVAAVMLDADRDGRADRVRLRFSERVRHAADRDRKYPFRVAGYRVRSVGKARGRRLVLQLIEKSGADESATPPVRYRRTKAKPVRDRAGNQAMRQTFRGVRAHGSGATGPATTPLPPPSPPPPPPNPDLPPDTDPDRDGYAAPGDCEPNDPAVHPSAEDLPDLTFTDTNCDGIDGTEAKAVFASPGGNDANPGTKAAPKRQIQTAVAAAAATGRYVLAAAGQFGRVVAASGVGIYGAYDGADWARKAGLNTSIVGGPESILASSATGVVLQYLSVVSGSPGGTGASAYGIRAINGASLTVQRVTVTVGNGAPGAVGATGEDGRPGGKGRNGPPGNCDGATSWSPALGGVSPVGRDGGMGGMGGDVDDDGHGQTGATGVSGTPGGAGGAAGDPGKPGQIGENGLRGGPGSTGQGASNAASAATTSWTGGKGGTGGVAAPGEGGGGGGGGGGQTGLFVTDGTGNFGGGGGGGGEGGRGGGSGTAGGGSFGIYLHNSTVTVSESSSITPGNGGDGGRGGAGGSGGFGGPGGIGGSDCTSEVGAGGNGGAGGRGGDGGGGGGGAGGPSIGIFNVGTSTATVTDSTVTNGTPGAGGAGGSGGSGNAGTGTPGVAQPIYPS